MVNTIRGNNLGDASFLSIQGKKATPDRVLFFYPACPELGSLSPLANHAQQAPKSNSREGVAFLFAKGHYCT